MEEENNMKGIFKHEEETLKNGVLNSISGCCVDCDWSGNISETDTETYYDDFKGVDISYPICPKCEGVLEISYNYR